MKRLLIYLVLGGVGLFMLLPFLWMLSTSLKAPGEVFTTYDNPLRPLLPYSVQPENYGKVYEVTREITATCGLRLDFEPSRFTLQSKRVAFPTRKAHPTLAPHHAFISR